MLKNFSLCLLLLLFLSGCGNHPHYGSEIDSLLSLQEEKPDSLERLNDLIEKFLENSFFEECLPYVDKYVALAPADKAHYELIGSYYERLHDAVRAKNHYQTYPLKNLEVISAYPLAKLEFSMGHFDTAQEIISKALKNKKLSPADAVSCLNLEGDMELLKKQDMKAIMNYEEALLLDPSNRETLLDLGNIYFKNSDFIQAKNQYFKILDDSPYDFYANIRAGLCSYRENDKTKAMKYFGRATREDPEVLTPLSITEIKHYYGGTALPGQIEKTLHSGLVYVKQNDWWKQQERIQCFVLVESLGFVKAENVKVKIQMIGDTNEILDQTMISASPSNLLPGQCFFVAMAFRTSKKIKTVKAIPSWKTE